MSGLPEKNRSRGELDLLVKFSITGGSGVLVNFLCLYLLLLVFNESLSVGLAIFISITTNYVINRIWTFRSDASMFIEYLKYLLSALTGSIIQYFTTIELTRWFRDQRITKFFRFDIIFLSVAIGIGLGFLTNFIISRFYVFRTTMVKNNSEIEGDGK